MTAQYRRALERAKSASYFSEEIRVQEYRFFAAVLLNVQSASHIECPHERSELQAFIDWRDRECGGERG